MGGGQVGVTAMSSKIDLRSLGGECISVCSVCSLGLVCIEVLTNFNNNASAILG